MYIHNIYLENIRGFEKLNFDLQRSDKSYAGWTVFVGENGSGKSTLLKAIALCLVGIDTVRVLEPNLNDWVRRETHAGVVGITIKRIKEDKIPSFSGLKRTLFRAGWRITRQADKFLDRLPIDSNNSQKVQEANKERELAGLTILNPEAKGWFSCGYGPFRRILGKPTELKGLERRFITLFSESASLADVDSWLKQLKYKKLENKIEEAKQLETLIELLNDDLLPNSVEVKDVTSEGMWLTDIQGIELTWGDMSDGYRSVLALIADIMRHLFSSFDHETLIEKVNGRVYIKASGVVLIDEIDAHLHPEWQMKIGFWLKERFPNIQFLVTTHSPIICQAADENGLFVLPSLDSDDEPRAISDDEYRKIIVWKSESILLSSLFGLENTRSEKIVEMTMRYSDLIAKKQSGIKLSKAEVTELKQLEFIVEAEDE